MGNLIQPVETRPPQLHPEKYDSFEKGLVLSLDKSQNSNQNSWEYDDNFEVWNATSVGLGFFILNHMFQFDQSNPNFAKMHALMAQYLVWYDKKKPRYQNDVTPILAYIRWICHHVRPPMASNLQKKK